jgi:DNA-binding MarR family transcriptional regulator
LESLAGVVDQGRANSSAPERLPGLVAEGVVGATFGVIHARLLELRPGPLIGLLGSLMATIVLPYRGSAAAAKELGRPVPRPGRRGASRSSLNGSARPAWRSTYASERGRRPIVRDRPAPPIVVPGLTIRTQMALAAVGGRPGLNNSEVSEIIGLADQSQISRMMKRLQGQGLIENVQGHNTRRQVRAWRLTTDGEAVIDAHKPLKQAQRTAGNGGRLATKSNRKGATFTPASSGPVASAPRGGQAGPHPLRMTVRTHEVLAAIAALGAGESKATNREIASAAGVKDQGQISKLLARLEHHGLLQNTSGNSATGNAWQLTKRGAELLAASHPSREGAGK